MVPFCDFLRDVFRVASHAAQEMRSDGVLKFQADEEQAGDADAACVYGSVFVKCGFGMMHADEFVVGSKAGTP